MSHDVFISYADEDRFVASTISQALYKEEIVCWMAKDSIPAGVFWDDAVAEAINGCRLVVLVLSQSSLKSAWVHNEINLSTNHDIPIIPLIIDSDITITGSMELLIGRFQRIDIGSQPMEFHLPVLANAVKLLLASRRTRASRCKKMPRRKKIIDQKSINHREILQKILTDKILKIKQTHENHQGSSLTENDKYFQMLIDIVLEAEKNFLTEKKNFNYSAPSQLQIMTKIEQTKSNFYKTLDDIVSEISINIE